MASTAGHKVLGWKCRALKSVRRAPRLNYMSVGKVHQRGDTEHTAETVDTHRVQQGAHRVPEGAHRAPEESHREPYQAYRGKMATGNFQWEPG